jgi:hypothetical protein
MPSAFSRRVTDFVAVLSLWAETVPPISGQLTGGIVLHMAIGFRHHRFSDGVTLGFFERLLSIAHITDARAAARVGDSPDLSARWPYARLGSCSWRVALELNVALLRDRCPLDRDHLPLHLRQLSRRLLIATDEESSGPEDNEGGRGCPAVFCALTVLRAREGGRPCRMD